MSHSEMVWIRCWWGSRHAEKRLRPYQHAHFHHHHHHHHPICHHLLPVSSIGIEMKIIIIVIIKVGHFPHFILQLQPEGHMTRLKQQKKQLKAS